MAHQHYKGTGKMHSFRGLLANETQERIRIQGATGEIAWRITKFQVIGNDPGLTYRESIAKIYRNSPSTVTSDIDFTDEDLLAAAYYTSRSDVYAASTTVIFDNTLFNRNIYITYKDVSDATAINYYIELEEVKISQAGMAQLAVATARRDYVPGT